MSRYVRNLINNVYAQSWRTCQMFKYHRTFANNDRFLCIKFKKEKHVSTNSRNTKLNAITNRTVNKGDSFAIRWLTCEYLLNFLTRRQQIFLTSIIMFDVWKRCHINMVQDFFMKNKDRLHKHLLTLTVNLILSKPWQRQSLVSISDCLTVC